MSQILLNQEILCNWRNAIDLWQMEAILGRKIKGNARCYPNWTVLSDLDVFTWLGYINARQPLQVNLKMMLGHMELRGWQNQLIWS